MGRKTPKGALCARDAVGFALRNAFGQRLNFQKRYAGCTESQIFRDPSRGRGSTVVAVLHERHWYILCPSGQMPSRVLSWAAGDLRRRCKWIKNDQHARRLLMEAIDQGHARFQQSGVDIPDLESTKV